LVSKTEKKSWVTTMVLASEGSPRPVRVREWLTRPATALKTRLLSCNSSRLPGVGDSLLGVGLRQ
jgi:hypothetical protein